MVCPALGATTCTLGEMEQSLPAKPAKHLQLPSSTWHVPVPLQGVSPAPGAHGTEQSLEAHPGEQAHLPVWASHAPLPEHTGPVPPVNPHPNSSRTVIVVAETPGDPGEPGTLTDAAAHVEPETQRSGAH